MKIISHSLKIQTVFPVFCFVLIWVFSTSWAAFKPRDPQRVNLSCDYVPFKHIRGTAPRLLISYDWAPSESNTLTNNVVIKDAELMTTGGSKGMPLSPVPVAGAYEFKLPDGKSGFHAHANTSKGVLRLARSSGHAELVAQLEENIYSCRPVKD